MKLVFNLHTTHIEHLVHLYTAWSWRSDNDVNVDRLIIITIRFEE